MDPKLPASSAAGIEPTLSQSGQQDVVLTSPEAILSTAIKQPPELLLMGLRGLPKTKCLRELRLVSWQFNAWLLLLAYYHITLNDAIVGHFNEPQSEHE